MSEWTVKSQLKGSFVIGQHTYVKAADSPLVLGLTGMHLKRVLDDKGKPTAIHEMTATLVFDTDSAKLGSAVVHDRVVELLQAARSILCLASGRRIEGLKSFSATAQVGKAPPMFRQIIGGPDQFVETPPVVLQRDVFTVPLDSKSRRVVTWWSRGLPPGDTADRLISLNNALDMLASSLALGKPRVVTCKECGSRREIAPGTRDNVMAFLEQSGVLHDDAADIWEARIHLAHGISKLTIEDDRRYDRHCNTLLRVIRDTLARALGVALPNVQLTRFHERSSHMDMTYTPPYVCQCCICGSEFEMRADAYNGKVIPRYQITVCRGYYESNPSGWPPSAENVVTAKLREGGLPMPERNEHGRLPRD